MKKKLSMVLVVWLSVFCLESYADSTEVKAALLALLDNQASPDCNQAYYRPGASARSLMSWSNTYQDDVIKQLQVSKINRDHSGASHSCMKVLQLRGQAVCKKPTDVLYQSKLRESMKSCSRLFLADESVVL